MAVNYQGADCTKWNRLYSQTGDELVVRVILNNVETGCYFFKSEREFAKEFAKREEERERERERERGKTKVRESEKVRDSETARVMFHSPPHPFHKATTEL